MQPHGSFFTVLFPTGAPKRGDQPYGIGLRKLAPQHFIGRGRDRQGFEKNLDVSKLKQLSSNDTRVLS